MTTLTSVSTDDIGQGGVVDAWTRFISTHVGRAPRDADEGDVNFAPGGGAAFRGVIEYGNLGPASLCRVANTAQRFVRNAGPGPLPGPAAMIVVQTRGVSHVDQDGRRASLSPGQWSVCDTGRAFSISNVIDAEHVILMQYHDAANALLSALLPLAARSFGGAGAERLACDLIVGAFRDCGQLRGAVADTTADAIARMVLACVEEAGARAPLPVGAGVRQRIVAFIDAHLADEGLGAATIAAEFGYSTRQIHRLFHDGGGVSIAEHVWLRRLERSFDDLRRAGDGETITEIAFRWGFSSSAHFSRVFRERFGISPRECRQSVAAG